MLFHNLSLTSTRFLAPQNASAEKSVFFDDFYQARAKSYYTYHERTVGEKGEKDNFSETIDEVC